MDSVQSFYANSLCFIGNLMVATEFKRVTTKQHNLV